MKRISPFLAFFLLTSLRVSSQKPMTIGRDGKLFYQDSILSIEWNLIHQTNDTSTFKLSIKPNSKFSLAIKNHPAEINETKKSDSLVSYIWIVTPDIHAEGYYLQRYNTGKPFLKSLKVSRKKNSMTLGIQLVVIEKSKSKGRHSKFFYAPNDGRLIGGLKVIWLNHINLSSQNSIHPTIVSYRQ
jgi:hypothetical protein